MPPTEYLEKWSPRDRGLAEALIVHEDTTHGPCGHQLSESTNDDMDGWYEVDDSTVCHACAALERFRDEAKDGAEPGVLLRVVDVRPPQDTDTGSGSQEV